MPEAIQNTDGAKKQDCESKAAKRFIEALKKAHPRQGFIIGGDGLMSHQPMMETVIENGMHCLFVAKPGDHKYLLEWIETFGNYPTLKSKISKGGSINIGGKIMCHLTVNRTHFVSILLNIV